MFSFIKKTVAVVVASLPTVKKVLGSLCTALGVLLTAIEVITA